MKRVVLASVAALTIGTLPAIAADIPVKAPRAPIAVPMAYNWAGFYIGGNVGYSFGRADTTLDAQPFNFDLRPDGVVGGGQIGANWQSGNFVYGLEADLQASGQRDEVICPVPTCTPVATARGRFDWFGTGRLRLGYAADSWLLYATGGVAYGRVGFGAVQLGVYSVEYTRVKVGWTAGAGLEWGFAPNWSAKIEYLYVDLGTTGITFLDPVLPAVNFSTRWTDNIVRVGLNYRFPWDAPLVARY